MRITCLGAAGTVTGSSYRVQTAGGDFLVDCGMFQGNSQLEMRNSWTEPYQAAALKGMFITHGHIDHSGLVPRLVREGFTGPIYASEGTCELLKILWLDSAHIQEMEAFWQTRKNQRRGNGEVEALYTTPDAEHAIQLLRPVELGKSFEMVPGAVLTPVGAGHILGAASLHVAVTENGQTSRVGFSGDIGRYSQLIVRDPDPLPELDMVFMESTYGGRKHKTLEDSQRELIEIVKEICHTKGKVIIPAFAVERSQEIIYTLAEAHRRGELPDFPVWLDSPLAIRATEIFRKHPEYFDAEAQAVLDGGGTPLNFPNLKFSLSTEDSRALNEAPGPMVIISASGMANAGRIKHHLKHNLWRSDCHVVIVGYQAKGTTGRALVDGAKRVKIFREDIEVRAKIHTIGGFSAHADQDELLEWLGRLARPGLTVNLIHGEPDSIAAFKKVARARFPKLNFQSPRWKETLEVRPIGAPAVADPKQRDLTRRLEALAQRVAATGGDPDRLAQLEAALAQAEAAWEAK